jgi:hypothetical protein
MEHGRQQRHVPVATSMATGTWRCWKAEQDRGGAKGRAELPMPAGIRQVMIDTG